MSEPAYLIDSSIYIYRGWHTVAEGVVAQDGVPVNAVHGFADFLLEILSQYQPQWLLCAFDDNSQACWRRAIYPAYKGNRAPTPMALRPQFALCRQLVQAAGIRAIGSPVYEADDIIGSYSRALFQEGIASVIVTADKDLTQLVQAGDVWWDFARNRRWGEREIVKNWGVKPALIADLLALCGDKSDNIIGIDGIGVTTAANLLNKFHSLENVLAHAGDIALMRFRGAMRTAQLLKEQGENARFARQLTGIVSCADLTPSAASIQRHRADWPSLQALLAYLCVSPSKQRRWQALLECA